MEDVIKAFRCRAPEERIPVLRLELDYELAQLYEAMMENSQVKVDECKQRLEKIRREMLMLEAL
ncbi:hypothetical protein [Thermoflavimicrobium daqui]|uniref:Uncharacterized protein n=1 Tax=Thermoflavimicrobium daqui TaxID=2137476 RepID=A0A364K6X6_9BACL|nr:hypothetical protein [Thermoflavimicrobium daqui]RAL26055.1 hypothetical protein DL897_07915 [Thermoflavimicrobium daqui]